MYPQLTAPLVNFPLTLPIGRYRFTLCAEQPFTLTGYPGAMLRGAFGHALRALACSTGQAACEGCSIRRECRYTRLFEPPSISADGGAHRDIPPPYIIQAPLTRPRILCAGERWSFDVILFGESALAELPLVIWAWSQAARKGLGAQRCPMRLTGVSYELAPDQWQLIWQQQGRARVAQLPRVAAHDAMLHIPSFEHVAEHAQCSMTLLTPTRLQSRGRICRPENVKAPLLLAALWRKIALYLEHYTSLELPAMPSIEGIHLEQCQLYRQRWGRHSNRQQREMRLDGVLGSLLLHGRLDAWALWLWLGQYTHLGKNTSFGLGQYRLAENFC